jgi:hypothetical protein
MLTAAAFSHAFVARVSVVLFGALVSPLVSSASFESRPGFSDVVTVESLGPPSLVASGTGAWILYAPTLSVDCSPPRGCYDSAHSLRLQLFAEVCRHDRAHLDGSQ